MGDDHALEIVGISTVKIKMFERIIRIIEEVRRVKGLKKNLLSLGQIDSHGCKTHVENGIMKIARGVLVLMKAEKISTNLFMLKGKTPCCTLSKAIGVNAQMYTTSNIMISIQNRLHMDCCYGNCYNNFISAILILN